jgi:hypothetical protein
MEPRPEVGELTMLKRLNPSQVAIFVAVASLVGCGGDRALLLSPRLDGSLPLGIISDSAGARVAPLRRQTALTKDDSWSFDVGPSGMVVRRPSTGLTIVVPEGAVSATTHITVTAFKGHAIAYRFEPHGLQFAIPLQLSQSLRGTKVDEGSSASSLFGGYFADDTLPADSTTGDLRVREILPVLIDVKSKAAVLSIHHFSGYTVASAVVGDDPRDLR